jgi:predicted RNA methylase
MQGPERREWYRRHNPEHVRAVADLVERALTARGGRGPGHAVVLGAGACTELPLARLARGCAMVTLVDLDGASMERARHELPRELRSRVRLLRTDISGGISATLATQLRAQPWADLAQLDQHAVLDAAAACLEQSPVPDIVPGMVGSAAPYDVVISSLVLTQLFSLPLLDVLDTLAAVAPGMIGLQDAHPRYHAAAEAFRRRVILAHLDLLAALLEPSGAGALITDVSGHLLAAARKGDAAPEAERFALLPRDGFDLPTELARRFTVDGKIRSWRWVTNLPAGAQPGRAYEVVGAVLRAGPGAPIR